MRKDVGILLVEDDMVDVKTVRRAFKENKIFNPLHVSGNGEEALDFLRNSLEKSERLPGLILLDLNMPVMGGIEFLKVAKADDALKRVPVIVLTTSREENDKVESYNLSVAGYIIKPVDFSKFVDVVKVMNMYWSLCEL